MDGSRKWTVGMGLLCGLLLLGPGLQPALAEEEIRPAQYDKQRISDLEKLYFSDEQLVEVTTRAPKPLPRVAENVTIVTADQIAEMNAHTLSEVLNHVPGLFVAFYHMDFGDIGNFRVQGLLNHHVLVLIDGIRLNSANGGAAFANLIPIAIVKRIEIIRGPASSTWGSSLGGVINIFTKDPINSETPKGHVSGSYGEAQSMDLRADMAGKNYYLHAGHQESQGLKNKRFFDADSYFGKVDLDMPEPVDLTLSLGYTKPKNSWGDFPDWDLYAVDTVRQTYGSVALDVRLAPNLALHAAVKLNALNYNQAYYDLAALGWYGGAKDDFLYDYIWNESTVSSELRLAYSTELQSVVVGAELSRSRMEFTNNNNAVFQGWGMPATYQGPRTMEEVWGVYINDTLSFGRLTVTPGLRYDHHSISQCFTSPSLGATYKLGDETITKFVVARGFVYPGLSLIGGGGANGNIFNPTLKPEKVVSVQAGLESMLARLLRYRLGFFRHELKDVWEEDATVSMVNGGRTVRSGLEIEAETAAYYNLSLVIGYTYVHERNLGIKDADDLFSDLDYVPNDDMYGAKISLNYNDGRYRAQLFGNYTWWDFSHTSSMPDRNFSGFIWDLALGAKVLERSLTAVELFATIHNLTNDRHHWDIDYHNPDRWVEAGVTIRF